jgi:hypothetical protein
MMKAVDYVVSESRSPPGPSSLDPHKQAKKASTHTQPCWENIVCFSIFNKKCILKNVDMGGCAKARSHFPHLSCEIILVSTFLSTTPTVTHEALFHTDRCGWFGLVILIDA